MKYAGLKNVWLEIQVRSILEHAWAEIQHGIVYKSAIRYPAYVLRKFAALAGTLEILEGEFLALKDEREKLIDLYRQAYSSGSGMTRTFDPARLLGFLESVYPDNPGWRSSARQGQPLPARTEVNCVDALRAVYLSNTSKLGRKLHLKSFHTAARRFARKQGVRIRDLSHLSLVVLAVATENSRVLAEYFPGMVNPLTGVQP